RTCKERARKVMTQMVNVLGAKTKLSSPMICSYLLNLPDHYTNHKFTTFYWKSFVKGMIMGVSPVEDYIHHPPELESWSLYDWICLCNRAPNSAAKCSQANKNGEGPLILESEHDTDDDNVKDDGDSCGSGDNTVSLYKVKYAPDDSDSNDGDGPIKKRVGRKTKIRRFKFTAEHPMYETHHIALHPEETRRVPNFVGGLLPRVDKGDHEYYCLTMLMLFQPWRTGEELKSDRQCTWEKVFSDYTFSDCQHVVMENFNLRYECLDAHDDYRA
ncbi:hypothetical protein ARMSODRAFT_845549, partial [Armillaria solidipes]